MLSQIGYFLILLQGFSLSSSSFVPKFPFYNLKSCFQNWFSFISFCCLSFSLLSFICFILLSIKIHTFPLTSFFLFLIPFAVIFVYLAYSGHQCLHFLWKTICFYDKEFIFRNQWIYKSIFVLNWPQDQGMKNRPTRIRFLIFRFNYLLPIAQASPGKININKVETPNIQITYALNRTQG